MKKITILVSLVALFAISSLNVNAQATATATASSSATILAPIAIAKNVDMNFGNVAMSNAAGTVVLATDNSRTTVGGVTLPPTTGTVSAAKFTVTGDEGAAYTITLPGTISLSNGTQTMSVGSFTSTPTPTGVLTGGTQEIFVGATLNVGALQAAGVYTNASDLFVTVNYN